MGCRGGVGTKGIDGYFVNTTFLLLPAKDLDEACVTGISRLKMQYWPYPLEEQKKWLYEKTDQTDFHLLGYGEDANLVGYLRITKRNLAIRGTSVVANGISSVCVDGACRGRSIGGKLMERANEHISESPKEIGLLACEKSHVGFYESCGWVPHKNCFYQSDNDNHRRKKFFKDPYVFVFPASAQFLVDVFVNGESF